MHATPTTELLDAAYFLCKGGGLSEALTDAKAELARRWPALDPPLIDQACDRALQLVDIACVRADELRGPRNDHTGSTDHDLRKECPGFSKAVYIDVEGWALYLTK